MPTALGCTVRHALHLRRQAVAPHAAVLGHLHLAQDRPMASPQARVGPPSPAHLGGILPHPEAERHAGRL